MRVYDLTCLRLSGPMAISGNPSFSWKLASDQNGDEQTAYRLTLRKHDSFAALWDSGWTVSGDTLDIPYGGPELSPCDRWCWKLLVRDSAGGVTESEEAFFETGPRDGPDWASPWIYAVPKAVVNTAPPDSAEPGDMPPPSPGPMKVSLLRRQLTLPDAAVISARLYLTAESYCRVYINGDPTADIFCDPAGSILARRALYTTYDLNGRLQPGANCLGLELVEGGVSARLRVALDDGSVFELDTDSSWKCLPDGPASVCAGYMGEDYKASILPEGWALPGFDDADWAAVSRMPSPAPAVLADMLPPHRVIRRAAPVGLHRLPDGRWRFSAPETTVGRIVLKNISAPAGVTVSISCAEQTLEDGELALPVSAFDPLGRAVTVANYTFANGGPITWGPSFCYFSFRFVEISGYPGTLCPDNISIETIRSQLPRKAQLQASEPMLEALYDNMLRTIENNNHGVMSTCPNFEKNFTGADLTLAAEVMMTGLDMYPLLAKAMTDFRDAQAENGGQAEMAAVCEPKTLPEWSSVNVHMARFMSDYLGCKDCVGDYYDANRRYADFELSHLEKTGYICGSFFGGDWNSPEGEFSPEGGEITASGYEYLTMSIISGMAKGLGRTSDAKYYAEKARRISEAINSRFLRDGYYETSQKQYFKRVGGPPWSTEGQTPLETGYRQTSNILPLALGIVPENMKGAVFAGLVSDIKRRGTHLDTGCIGTKFLLSTLTEMGEAELAYELATQKSFPSWGWWLKNGADTMYEDWTLTPRSACHYYLASGLCDWFMKYLAGIRLVENGFGSMLISPCIPKKLQSFGLSLETVRGRVASFWEQRGGLLHLDIELPPNSSARVVLPDGASRQVRSGRHSFTCELSG